MDLIGLSRSEALADLSTQKPTPTPASYEAALGFEQSVFGSHGRHLDGPSKVWIPIAVIYTFIVGFGMTTLFFQRFTHTARIRGYWLSSTSVIALHVYLTMILIEYPIRFWYVCAAEFWVMALIFPVGLGLYQRKCHHSRDIASLCGTLIANSFQLPHHLLLPVPARTLGDA
ncbi:hypothetical protein SLS54_001950 [Diplodia seriata]